MNDDQRIEELERQVKELSVALGEVTAERNRIQERHEEALGNLQFASDKVGALLEEIEDLKTELAEDRKTMELAHAKIRELMEDRDKGVAP